MDTSNRITQNLKNFGLSTEIKPITMKHLLKIDDVLQKMINTKSSAIQEIKGNKLSLNRVANESGIARQTLYNNPIITKYIECYFENYDVLSPFEIIEALRDEITSKDIIISGLIKRDATVSKYKSDNQELKDEILSLQATIRLQEELIQTLRLKNV